MAEEYSEFAITMRGYDRAQVDRKLEQLSRQLADARREVASLDQRAMTLAGELADAQRRLRSRVSLRALTVRPPRTRIA